MGGEVQSFEKTIYFKGLKLSELFIYALRKFCVYSI